MIVRDFIVVNFIGVKRIREYGKMFYVRELGDLYEMNIIFEIWKLLEFNDEFDDVSNY